MAYTSIAELPSQVRNSLSEDDQEQWMKSYNECDPQNESDIKEARKKAWMECKDKPSSFSFHAVASVEDWDKDTEKIDVDTLMKSMDRYIDSGGPLSLDHRNYTIGCIWSYEPFEKNGMKGMAIWGNLFGGDDGVYDKVRGMFVKGMNSFSVAGESADKKYECDGHACGFKRSVSELLEIALCRTPANKHAVMLSYNDKVATPFSKSAGDVVVRFDQVEVHRDESSCPILKLRKSLRNAGIDAHAREDGVFIPMGSATFAKTVGTMRNAGLCVQWADGGALVRDQDAVLEGLFKEGFAKGIVDENGVLDTSDHMFFAKACDMGLIERRNGQYRLIDPSISFKKGEMTAEESEKAFNTMSENPEPPKYIQANHVIAYNNGGKGRSGKDESDDGSYHPEYVSAPVNSEDNIMSRSSGYSYIDEGQGDEEDITRYIPAMYSPMLNLSRANSGKIKGSNGFIDRQTANVTQSFDNSKPLKGFTAYVNPKGHRVFNNADDWIKFVQEAPERFNSWSTNDEDWYAPQWKKQIGAGTHSIEFPQSFFDDLKNEGVLRKLYANHVMLPGNLAHEPQIGILSPDAIHHTEPYEWDESKVNPALREKSNKWYQNNLRY